jgi:SAM-dependent methyltransferase
VGKLPVEEKYYDAILNIKTTEDRVIDPFRHYYPYQPTPYTVLQQLVENYWLKPSDRIVDFGCGKGRTLIYLHHNFGASVCGIEINANLYKAAEQNRLRYIKRKPKYIDKIQFHHTIAENYDITPEDNKFYFFHPFSMGIFKTVIQRVLASFDAHPREVELILYYPPADYLHYIEEETDFVLSKEIKINGVFEQNPNEKIMIYTLK